MPVLTAVGHGSLCAAFPVLLRILIVSEFFHGLAVTTTNPKVAPLWTSALNFCRTSDHLVAYAFALYSRVYGNHLLHRWPLRSDILNRRRRQRLKRFQRTSQAVFGSMFGMRGFFMINRSI